MATKVSKMVIQIPINEIEFEDKTERDVFFVKLGDNIVICDKNENLSFDLNQFVEKLDDLYSDAELGTYANDVLLLAKHFMEQIQEDFG